MEKTEAGLTLKHKYTSLRIAIHTTTVPDAMEICFVIIQYFLIRPKLV